MRPVFQLNLILYQAIKLKLTPAVPNFSVAGIAPKILLEGYIYFFSQ
jgi:hypothetical protein